MKACVKEYRDIDVNEISEKYIEGIPVVGVIPVEADWICVNPPKNQRNTITRYYIQESGLIGSVTEKPEYYDLLEVIMICLGDENQAHYEGILKLLDVLFSSELEA